MTLKARKPPMETTTFISSQHLVPLVLMNCIALNEIYDKIVTPCFDSLAIRQSPQVKDTSPQHRMHGVQGLAYI